MATVQRLTAFALTGIVIALVIALLVGGVGGGLGSVLIPSSEAALPVAQGLSDSLADVTAEMLALPAEVATLTEIVTAQVIDWDKLKQRAHVRARHTDVVIDCTAEIFKLIGGSEAWMSDRPVLPQKDPKLPSFVITRNVGQAIRQLGSRASACAGLTSAVIKQEFGVAYEPKDLVAVAIFAYDVDPITLAEHNVFITMYFVPVSQFEMWRCDWHLTNKVYPTPGYFPCR